MLGYLGFKIAWTFLKVTGLGLWRQQAYGARDARFVGMARAPDQKYLNPNPGYRKGDRHSGGGKTAGGGKHRLPQNGWEKGDAVRHIDAHRTDPPLPRKPSPHPK